MKRALLALAALLLVALGAAVAFVLYREHEARNVHGSSTIEFVTTEPVPQKPKEPGVVWPTYGYDAERLRFVPGLRLRPPFRRVWMFRAQALVEFPPVIAYGRLYVATNAGDVFAVSLKTGRRAWVVHSHRCQAASPAVDDHLVYVTFLNRPPCNASRSNVDGLVAAYDSRTGRLRWQKHVAPTESSPLVANGAVYVGDWSGRVYALAKGTGRQLWSFKTGDKVKGAVAVSGKRLYVGSYDNHVYALSAYSGRLLWRASAQQRLGSQGTFYSTPAVAYGRVYIGSTDGKMYSYGATSGKLRWSYSTGGYVYSSPAVWNGRVYAGSYSGRFYAFDAATGDVKWRFKANGPISGSPTVVDGVVYFATLKRRTYALDGRTGRFLWSFPDGKYTPVVADKDALYVVGYTRIYRLARR